MSDGSFERGLSAVLVRATDELPRNAHRYEQVLRRGRRQQAHGLGVLTVSAVLVLAVGGAGPVLRELDAGSELAAGGGDAERSVGEPNDDTAPTPRCPKPAADIGDPRPTGGGPLVPAGATAAKLCASFPGGRRESGPIRHRDLDPLIAKLNALPAYDPDSDCGYDLGPTYDIVLAYPDGHTAVATFESFGCGIARSGDEYRQGANRLARRLYEVGSG